MRSNDPLQIGFVGAYPPSRCGIGTFTHDLSDAVMTADEGIGATVLAMTAADFDSEYPERVRFQIRREVQGDYARAARFVNDGDIRRSNAIRIPHSPGNLTSLTEQMPNTMIEAGQTVRVPEATDRSLAELTTAS